MKMAYIFTVSKSHGHHVLEVLHLEEFTPGPVNIQGYRLQCFETLERIVCVESVCFKFLFKEVLILFAIDISSRKVTITLVFKTLNKFNFT